MTVLLVAVAAVYGIVSFLLFVFGTNLVHFAVRVWRRGPRPTGTSTVGDTDVLPLVTVQLPIYNELYVSERVIGAACELDYPRDRLQIQVLDDSTDETSVLIAQVIERFRGQGINIEHRHRTCLLYTSPSPRD